MAAAAAATAQKSSFPSPSLRGGRCRCRVAYTYTCHRAHTYGILFTSAACARFDGQTDFYRSPSHVMCVRTAAAAFRTLRVPRGRHPLTHPSAGPLNRRRRRRTTTRYTTNTRCTNNIILSCTIRSAIPNNMSLPTTTGFDPCV